MLYQLSYLASDEPLAGEQTGEYNTWLLVGPRGPVWSASCRRNGPRDPVAVCIDIQARLYMFVTHP
jgi:hypothetical protein